MKKEMFSNALNLLNLFLFSLHKVKKLNMPVKKKTNTRYALRKRANGTRVVQCNKSSRGGYQFSSDRKKCNTKTYRNKTEATKALKTLKKQEFGRRKRVTNGFGRKRKCKKKTTQGYGFKKKYRIVKYYVVCRDPNNDEKVKAFPAYKIRHDGETYKIMKMGSGYETQYFRLDSDTKLYDSKDKKSGKLRKAKFEGNILDVLNLEKLCPEMMEEIGASDLPGAGYMSSYESFSPGRYASQYSRSIPGLPQRLSGYSMDLNGVQIAGMPGSNIPVDSLMSDKGILGSVFASKLQPPDRYSRSSEEHYKNLRSAVDYLGESQKAVGDSMKDSSRRDPRGRDARRSLLTGWLGEEGLKKKQNQDLARWQHDEEQRVKRGRGRFDYRTSKAQNVGEGRTVMYPENFYTNKYNNFGRQRYRSQPSLMMRARRYRPMSRFGARRRTNYGFGSYW